MGMTDPFPTVSSIPLTSRIPLVSVVISNFLNHEPSRGDSAFFLTAVNGLLATGLAQSLVCTSWLPQQSGSLFILAQEELEEKAV